MSSFQCIYSNLFLLNYYELITGKSIEIFFKINNSDRPKQDDVHFFDLMGQILRIKYHIDPSSLSCILETIFDNIYSMYIILYNILLFILFI